MREKNENDPVEVFAGTNLQASIIKSFLESAEIEAFLKDDILGTLNPWWTDPGGEQVLLKFLLPKVITKKLKHWLMSM